MDKKFSDLVQEDTDLTMFSIQNLTLVKREQLVILSIVLKRKVATELLTTYHPTILLLLITFVTIFFDKDLFGDAIAVNIVGKKWEPRNPVPGPFSAKIRKVNQNSESRREFGK